MGSLDLFHPKRVLYGMGLGSNVYAKYMAHPSSFYDFRDGGLFCNATPKLASTTKRTSYQNPHSTSFRILFHLPDYDLFISELLQRANRLFPQRWPSVVSWKYPCLCFIIIADSFLFEKSAGKFYFSTLIKVNPMATWAYFNVSALYGRVLDCKPQGLFQLRYD